jgi:hypothetical protein
MAAKGIECFNLSNIMLRTFRPQATLPPARLNLGLRWIVIQAILSDVEREFVPLMCNNN